MMRRCSRCNVDNDMSAFGKASHGKDGINHQCKACNIERSREWAMRNPEHIRARRKARSEIDRANRQRKHAENPEEYTQRKRVRNLARFGMSLQDFEDAVREQDGKCAICKREPPEVFRGRPRWVVDHDHKCCPGTARSCGMCIRGLLCIKCNLAIGQFEDDIDRMQAAIAYLEAYIVNRVFRSLAAGDSESDTAALMEKYTGVRLHDARIEQFSDT